jgi:hypothetical protein
MIAMKKFLFTLATIIISFLIIEIFLGYVLWLKKSGIYSTTYYAISRIYARLYPYNNIRISFSPKSSVIPDKYLGYSDLSGSYTLELKDDKTAKQHRFTTSINARGNRITSFAPKLYEGKKEIWIFGDSYTYGWGNNDETTFPFFLQSFLPNFRLVNYAHDGYGNVHAYLQLSRELKTNHNRPSIIVIVYGDYFNVRNIAAPSRLKEYRYKNDVFSEIDTSAFLHPRASVKDGKLEIEYVPLFPKFKNESHDKDPAVEYQHGVTEKILSEIYDMGKMNGASMILAFIRGSDSDEVISFARKYGYIISDIRPKDGRNEWDDFNPFDSHPGPLAQDNYAIKLYETISENISNDDK